LQFIKKRFPDSSIDWFVDSQFANLLDGCPDIDNIISLNIKEIKKKKSISQLFKTLRKLRRIKKYDQVFDLQGLIKSAIITRFIPAEERIGFDRKSVREKLATYFYSKKYYFPYHQNVIERYTGLIASSLKIEINSLDIDEKRPFFNLSQTRFANNEPNIVIILGASFKSKIYPVDKYAQIVESLQANFIALWHSKEEFKMAKKLSSLSDRVSIVKSQSFYTLKKIIINSDLIIGGDTGPTHIAWALNKSSITIFGATPIQRNCFVTKKNLAISPGNKVNPYKINRKDFSIRDISSSEISLLAKRLLNL